MATHCKSHKFRPPCSPSEPKPPSLQELKPLRIGETFSKSIKARLPCTPAHRKYPMHHVFLRKDAAFKYIVAAATMCSWHANVYKKFLMMVAGLAIVLFVLHNLRLTSMTESRTERLCLLLYHLYILYPAIVCVCEGRGDPACNHHVAKHCICFEDVIG